jgi:hypothetical protein
MVKSPWPTYEKWEGEGLRRGYQDRNPASLQKSADLSERTWYNRGMHMNVAEHWLDNFSFDRIIETRQEWSDLESWKKYGIEKGYEKRLIVSLSESGNPNERAWYYRGRSQGWKQEFKFTKRAPWKEFNQWKDHGVAQGYDGQNSMSVCKSKEGKSWYTKGIREGWIGDFTFSKLAEMFQDLDSWRSYGTKKGYDLLGHGDFKVSKNPDQRRWYNKGVGEGWLRLFNLKRKQQRSQFSFEDQETWKEHGFERQFYTRNPESLRLSQNPNERYWFNKGRREGWLEDFPLAKKRISAQMNEGLDEFVRRYEEDE